MLEMIGRESIKSGRKRGSILIGQLLGVNLNAKPATRCGGENVRQSEVAD